MTIDFVLTHFATGDWYVQLQSVDSSMSRRARDAVAHEGESEQRGADER